MYLYIVNFLRLLHGLCLLYFVEGRRSGIANPGRDILTVHPKITIIDMKVLEDLSHQGTHAGSRRKRDAPSDSTVCLTVLCKVYQERLKRSVLSDSIAQRNQTDDVDNVAKQTDTDDNDKKRKQTLLSEITPYAFGNPSLPDQSKKGKRRPKPRKPGG